jgi:hypothetical protein
VIGEQRHFDAWRAVGLTIDEHLYMLKQPESLMETHMRVAPMRRGNRSVMNRGSQCLAIRCARLDARELPRQRQKQRADSIPAWRKENQVAARAIPLKKLWRDALYIHEQIDPQTSTIERPQCSSTLYPSDRDTVALSQHHQIIPMDRLFAVARPKNALDLA